MIGLCGSLITPLFINNNPLLSPLCPPNLPSLVLILVITVFTALINSTSFRGKLLWPLLAESQGSGQVGSSSPRADDCGRPRDCHQDMMDMRLPPYLGDQSPPVVDPVADLYRRGSRSFTKPLYRTTRNIDFLTRKCEFFYSFALNH